MSATQSSADTGARGFYFFLSYAQTPPSLDLEESAPDLWVTTLYHDLSAQISRLAKRGSDLETGFMEGLLPMGQDWKSLVHQALGTAEVFVPLYSPAYRTRSWPLSEWAAFRKRLSAAHERSRGHVQPVLWVPLAPGEHTPELDAALDLGAQVPEYAKTGLLAMCRLTIFREQYATIVRELAERIVTAAETRPLGRSPTPVTIEDTRPSSEQTRFVIGVIAPKTGELAAPARSDRYGDAATAWRPFEQRDALPVGEYAAYVAQRLGLGTDTMDLLTNTEGLTANPGIVLIDPWILAVAGGRTRLQGLVKSLPEWVVLVVVTGESGTGESGGEPVTGEAFFAETVTILSEHQHHIVKFAHEVSAFDQIMPSVVNQARRRFLSRAPMFPPQRPGAILRRPGGLPRLDDLTN